MHHEELLEQIRSAIVALDEPQLRQLTTEVQRSGLDPLTAIEEGYTVGIQRIGERFGRGELFLPELVSAGGMVKEQVAVLERHISAEGRPKKGRFLIGTVEGDIHDIGKNLVGTMLASRGIEVVDMGVDVPATRFVEEAIKRDADIIGASCLLTLTLPELPRLVEELTAKRVRGSIKLMVGGAAVNRDFAQEIGADAYGEDLREAADVAAHLLEGG